MLGEAKVLHDYNHANSFKAPISGRFRRSIPEAADKVGNFATGPVNIIGPNRGASALLQNEEESTRIPLVRHKPCPWFAAAYGGAGRDKERRRSAAFSPDAHLAFYPRHLRVKCRVGPRARCVSFSPRERRLEKIPFFPAGGPRIRSNPVFGHSVAIPRGLLAISFANGESSRAEHLWTGRFPWRRRSGGETFGGLARKVEKIVREKKGVGRHRRIRWIACRKGFVFELFNVCARARERASEREWRERC